MVIKDQLYPSCFGKDSFTIAEMFRIKESTVVHVLFFRHTWSTKVTDILGHEYAFVDDYRTRELMVRDLLSHRTGLGNLDEGLIAGFPEHFSRADLCKYEYFSLLLGPMPCNFYRLPFLEIIISMQDACTYTISDWFQVSLLYTADKF